jgi:hypothetical protein
MALNIDNGDSSAIRYNLAKNAILEKSKGELSYYARVVANTKSLREVAETMVREGSKYSAYEVYCVLEFFTEVVTRLLKEGCAVNVGSLVRFRPRIQGKFASETDSFKRGVHRILVGASVGSALRNVAAAAPVSRVTAAVALPELLAVYNGATGHQDRVSNESTFIVKGANMVYDINAADEGFFVNLDGQELRCTVILMDEKHANAVLLMPQQIAPGNEVALSFRTRHTTSGGKAIISYGKTLVCEVATVE